MVSVCTLTSLLGSSYVLILCSLPDVSLSHCCINTCYKIVETTKSTNKLAKRLRLAKNKTNYMKNKNSAVTASGLQKELKRLPPLVMMITSTLQLIISSLAPSPATAPFDSCHSRLS